MGSDDFQRLGHFSLRGDHVFEAVKGREVTVMSLTADQMVASDLPVASPRLKREDCERTKHDSVFSKWQILVGPHDWEDYSLGKEGAARYRVHDLPKSYGPGVYELGVAVSRNGLGRAVGKLDPKRIVVVYLGQADNVRTRLQQYGRTGAHLGNSYFNANESKSVRLQKGPGLFEHILSRGYPIVFRWAAMDNKRDAEETEAQLLNRFDYAWNTSVNGTRRPNDILSKLNKIASKTIQFSDITRKLLPFDQKQVGVRIKASKLPLPEDKSNTCTDEGSLDFLPRVIKLNRSRPSSVLDGSGVMEQITASFCGVILGDGSACRRPPVVARKRCAEHGGMRITGFIPRLVAEGESESTDDYPVSGSYTPICGIVRSDGSPCRRQPAPGRKRCTEHKGMRIRGTVPVGDRIKASKLPLPEDKSNACTDEGSQDFLPRVIKFNRSRPSSVLNGSGVMEENASFCGVILGDGSACGRPPVVGRKRCAEHGGMRITGFIPRLIAEGESESTDDYPVSGSYTPICGIVRSDGSPCRRQPAPGRKRCTEHKSMRIRGTVPVGKSQSSHDVVLGQYNSCASWGQLAICGVNLGNGRSCSRQPVRGRVRCEEHKGLRVNSWVPK